MDMKHHLYQFQNTMTITFFDVLYLFQPDCSLHLTQKVSQLYPGSRSIPILSKKSAPGIVVATGVVGDTLAKDEDLHFNMYLSASAGVTWYEVLEGNHFYALGDHGGLIAAVEQGGTTNKIK